MEENVRKELDTLAQMVSNWKKSYVGWVTGDGGNEYILSDFSEEITTHILSFVYRLKENDHLTPTEARDFLDHCYAQVDELRKEIEEKEREYTEKLAAESAVYYL